MRKLVTWKETFINILPTQFMVEAALAVQLPRSENHQLDSVGSVL